MTKRFAGSDGKVTHLECVRVDWVFEDGQRPRMVEIPGSEFTIPADIVLLAMGFVHPQHEGLLEGLEVEYDPFGNVKTDPTLKSSVDKVFACGDMQRGQSLVVHAIANGRQCAREVDLFLSGRSSLPTVRGYARPVIPAYASA